MVLVRAAPQSQSGGGKGAEILQVRHGGWARVVSVAPAPQVVEGADRIAAHVLDDVIQRRDPSGPSRA